MARRTLVTGGGGYVGTVLVRGILQHTFDQDLRVLDRFDWGVQPLVSAIPDPLAHRIQVQYGDVANPGHVASALEGVDAVIHLAGIVGFPACDKAPEDAFQTNVIGTQNVIDRLGGRPILFASTGSVYGKVAHGELCTEETPVTPLTHYGQTKLQAEQAVIDAGGMAFRIASLYGSSPRMRWDILPHDFTQAAVSGKLQVYDGGARRTFIHVEDVARAFYWALDHYQPGVFNLGDESGNLTKAELAERLRTLTGCLLTPIEGHDPDERDYAVSYQKIRDAGWEPIWDLDETLPHLVEVARAWWGRMRR